MAKNSRVKYSSEYDYCDLPIKKERQTPWKCVIEKADFPFLLLKDTLHEYNGILFSTVR